MADKYPVQYARILHQLMHETPESGRGQAIAAFIDLLYKDQKLSKAPYIIEEFEKIARLEDGTAPLSVTAAHELTQAMKEEIEKRFDGKVVDVTIDETLIGGVVVRKGNQVLNASIRAQLDHLAQSMK